MKTINSVVAVVLAVAFMATSVAAMASGGSETPTVNINTATETQLANLPGVGPSKAKAIIKYRDNRPFKKIEQIMRVKGIGRKSFKAMRPYLSVDGPTTVKKKIRPSK